MNHKSGKSCPMSSTACRGPCCYADCNHFFQSMEKSPQAWGRRRWCWRYHCSLRKIPTSVGKTLRRPHFAAGDQKHPHRCGEDLHTPSTQNQSPETPPQVWGRLRRDDATHAPAGNTPTGVGKTQEAIPPDRIDRKHPHRCGEDLSSVANTSTQEETPPQVWGRRPILVDHHAGTGNTPTGVGKTHIAR